MPALQLEVLVNTPQRNALAADAYADKAPGRKAVVFCATVKASCQQCRLVLPHVLLCRLRGLYRQMLQHLQPAARWKPSVSCTRQPWRRW